MFAYLPQEIINKIARYSDKKDKLKIRSTCKSLSMKLYLCASIKSLNTSMFKYLSHITCILTDKFLDIVTFENFPVLISISFNGLSVSDSADRLYTEIKIINVLRVNIYKDANSIIKYLPHNLNTLFISDNYYGYVFQVDLNPLPRELQKLIIIDNRLNEGVIEQIIPTNIKYLHVHNTRKIKIDLPELPNAEYITINGAGKIIAPKLKKAVLDFNIDSAFDSEFSNIQNLTISVLKMTYKFNQLLSSLTSLHTLEIKTYINNLIDLSMLPLKKVIIQIQGITMGGATLSNLVQLPASVKEFYIKKTYEDVGEDIIFDILPDNLFAFICKNFTNMVLLYIPSSLKYLYISDNNLAIAESEYAKFMTIDHVHMEGMIIKKYTGRYEYKVNSSFNKFISHRCITQLYQHIVELDIINLDRECVDLDFSRLSSLRILCIQELTKKHNIINLYKCQNLQKMHLLHCERDFLDKSVLPSCLVVLKVVSKYCKNCLKLNYIPPNLKYLNLSGDIIFDINKLPDSIKEMVIKNEIIKISSAPTIRVQKLPLNLEKLSTNYYLEFTSTCNIPPNLSALIFYETKYQKHFTDKIPNAKISDYYQ